MRSGRSLVQLWNAVSGENRQHPRVATWIAGRICPHPGAAGRRVLITDISAGGAGLQLVVPTDEPIPVSRFYLELGHEGLKGDLVCELVRQTPTRLHVRFLDLSWVQKRFLNNLLDSLDW